MLLILPFVSYLITLKRELLAKWQTFKTNFWILSKFIGFPPPLKLSMMSPSTFDGLSTFWRWRYFIWREERNSCGVKSCQMCLTLAGGGGERRPCPYQKWLLASAIESLMSSTSSLALDLSNNLFLRNRSLKCQEWHTRSKTKFLGLCK